MSFSSRLFPRWVFCLCIRRLLNVKCLKGCFEFRPTELVCLYHEEIAVCFLSFSKQAVSLPSPHCCSVPTESRENHVDSDLTLLGLQISLYFTVTGCVVRRKQLQPSFRGCSWLCWTCPMPVGWGRKPSCHNTLPLGISENEKAA